MINFAALVAFLLISPGLLVLFGIRTGSHHNSVSVESNNATSQIISLLVIAIGIQLFILPLYVCTLENVFNVATAPFFHYLLDGEDKPSTITLTAILFHDAASPNETKNFWIKDNFFYWSHWWVLFFYIAITWAFSVFAGVWLIRRIEGGCIKLAIFHGAFYELMLKARRTPVMLCTVLTKVSHGERHLMYEGRLKRVTFDKDGKINYLVLSHVKKFTLFFDKDEVITLDSQIPVAHSKTEEDMSAELFYIQGDEIANYLFSEYKIEGTVEAVLKEVQRVIGKTAEKIIEEMKKKKEFPAAAPNVDIDKPTNAQKSS